MSAIAANGIPKLEAGPQKSGGHQHVSPHSQLFDLHFFCCFNHARSWILVLCTSVNSAGLTEHATSLRYDRGEPLDGKTYELSIDSR